MKLPPLLGGVSGLQSAAAWLAAAAATYAFYKYNNETSPFTPAEHAAWNASAKAKQDAASAPSSTK